MLTSLQEDFADFKRVAEEDRTAASERDASAREREASMAETISFLEDEIRRLKEKPEVRISRKK